MFGGGDDDDGNPYPDGVYTPVWSVHSKPLCYHSHWSVHSNHTPNIIGVH